jgi:Fe-Mn family superoxide dismutase
MISPFCLTKRFSIARILLYIQLLFSFVAKFKENTMAFELPPMKYAFDALEPVIDARTVEIHHDKHHATYLKNLNTALENFPELAALPLEKILANLQAIPEVIRLAVKNNGGGVFNHNLYWDAMRPGQAEKPGPSLLAAIERTFTSFDQFKSDFEKAGLTRFGSGYAWLSVNPERKLIIHSTANQDCPLHDNLKPILVVDVWEHAYYLNYQNRRADYLAAWWNLVDWNEAETRYTEAMK